MLQVIVSAASLANRVLLVGPSEVTTEFSPTDDRTSAIVIQKLI